AHFPPMRELLVAPYNLHTRFLEMIAAEAANARAGRPAGIFAKVNSLVEEEIIAAIYEASEAGVPIRLLVRGMCSLRAGVPGASSRIEVRSIVGRFLEHSRIFRFENGGDPRIFLGSADWMPRNLFRRVEVVFPVRQPGLVRHLESIIEDFWRDNVKARTMRPDGTYAPLPRSPRPFDAQAEFIEEAQRRRRRRHAREES
ncbi:MAG: hypothetical protein N2322_04965, partial [Terrimicrobiaceae bacterium]|nr:hypothetical protein [Terrimicrobiaceae bacterium]